MGNQGPDNPGASGRPHAGYEYLVAYKLALPIYDYTVEFCRRHIDPKSRTNDQINQANYLIDKLLVSLKAKFVSEGGHREKLFHERLAYRRQAKKAESGKYGKSGEARSQPCVASVF